MSQIDDTFVEPVVTREKLLELLGLGGERRSLDFKQKVDLGVHNELVEFAKDVAALRSCGGYLVIGADDSGALTKTMTAELAKKFDEATLRPKLEKFLHPTDVITATHEVDGHHVVLVFVPRHRIGFTVVRGIGEYTLAAGKGQKIVLRPGDVFVRSGTSSELWSENHVEQLLHARDEVLRETFRRDFAATVAAIESGRNGQLLASGPSQSLTWRLDQDSFDATIVELLRQDDRIPIRMFLIRTAGDALATMSRGNEDEFGVILDRLISLGSIALTLGLTEISDEVIDQLAELYRNPPRPQGVDRSFADARFWYEIIARVFALGGLAAHLGQWAFIRRLATQTPADTALSLSSWLRHGLTMASRSNLFPQTNGHSESGGIIPAARRVTHRLPALRPYAPDDSAYDPEPGRAMPENDASLNALCVFDALTNVIIVSEPESEKNTYRSAYPSFGYYYGRRSAPALARLLSDAVYREALVSGVSDEVLEDALREVVASAEKVNTYGLNIWDHDEPALTRAITAAAARELARQGRQA